MVLVCGQLGLGGTERQLCLLAAGLRQRGVPVTVVALFEGGPRESELAEADVPVAVLGAGPLRRPWRTAAGLFRLWRILRRTRPGVVHAFLYHAYVLTAPVARLAGVPVLVAGRRSLANFKEGRPFARRLERLTNRLYDGFVANSDAVRRDALRHEGLAADRVVVIPNALPGGFGGPEAGDGRARVGSPPVVVCVANLIAYKGHSYLLEAAADLVAQGVLFRLVLVGDGPLRGELERKAGDLRLPVELAGGTTDVRPWLSTADVFVLPSLEEGMSNALMEALAYGLPVVATDVGGNAEVVGEAALLCRPADAADLAARLADVLRCPSLRSRLSTAARRRAVEQFGCSVMIDRHIAYYTGLLATKGIPCAA
ncbi:MAG TPA: glycosyltransferase [Acidimicrobiales bacterium]|nr:glycosyltransferase [Acidimicrobiales bacterium]